jgi:hypothetical protein
MEVRFPPLPWNTHKMVLRSDHITKHLCAARPLILCHNLPLLWMSECDPPTWATAASVASTATQPESPPARYKFVKVLISSFKNFLVYYALPSAGFAGPTLPSRVRILRGRCCSRSLTALWLHTECLQQAHKTVRDFSLVFGSFRWMSRVLDCGLVHQYRISNYF